MVVKVNLDIPIKGIQGEIKGDTLVIRSMSLLKTLSSAVLNGGLREAKAIITQQVPIDYDDADPESLLKSIVRSLNLPPENVIALMTAVDVSNVAVETQQDQGLTVSAIVTAAVSNPATAGDTVIPPIKNSGTINVILLIDGDLTEGCMVNAVKTATEAKSAALRELDIRSRFSGKPASGTTTDAIVVACTGLRAPMKYAGTATKLGELIGKSVKKAVKEAIEKQEGITPNRPLIKRLEERGITFEDLVKTALELYLPHPGVETREKALKLLKEGFDQALSDVNIAALTMAGLRLEEDGRRSLIPSLLNETFEKDPAFLVADEILGMAIANYIAGTRGVLEYVRFDELKPGMLKKLGPILDDAICGIIAGVSSNMYSRALRSKK